MFFGKFIECWIVVKACKMEKPLKCKRVNFKTWSMVIFWFSIVRIHCIHLLIYIFITCMLKYMFEVKSFLVICQLIYALITSVLRLPIFFRKQDQKSNRFDSISNNGCFRLMILTHSHTPDLEMLSHLINLINKGSHQKKEYQ